MKSCSVVRYLAALGCAGLVGLAAACGQAGEGSGGSDQRVPPPRQATVSPTSALPSPTPSQTLPPIDEEPFSEEQTDKSIEEAISAEPTAQPVTWPESAPFMGDKLTTDELKAHLGEPGVVRIKWQTQSEKDSFGFLILRSETGEENSFVPINEAKPVLGAGNSSTAHYYDYYDKDVKVGGVYYYKINSIELDGNLKPYRWTIKIDVRRLYLNDKDPASTSTQSTQ